MTQPHPQPHCDHECVCPDYRASNSECDEEDPDPCTIPCMQRATHPAVPAELLCDECNIIELEERLMNLEQELKDARKDERERVLDKKNIAIIRKGCLHPYWETCGGLNCCQHFVEKTGDCLFDVDAFIESLRGGAT